MVIKCVSCGNKTRAKHRSKKRCKPCKIKTMRKASQKRENSFEGYRSRREGQWRRRGMIGLTWEKWKRDEKKGCGLRFLGNCGGRIVPDHDQETGFYRGPLCDNHNRGLGRFGDTNKSLKRVIKVLERNR